MKYECVNYAGGVFIETPADEVDVSEPYLVYNKTCYQEATEYFKKRGIQCVDAFIYEGDRTILNLIVEGTIELRNLYCIAENAKICEQGNNKLKIQIPL